MNKEYDSSDEDNCNMSVDNDSDRNKDANLERVLREYNSTQSRENKRNRMPALARPFDLPYYKGIQLPEHLKWLTIYSNTHARNTFLWNRTGTNLANEIFSNQEIEALELEL